MTLTPLTEIADDWLGALAASSGNASLAGLDGATLLGERAMLAGLRIPGGGVSAGGGCRLWPAQNGAVALNLARDDDRALLPALFGGVECDVQDDEAIGAIISRHEATPLVQRGRMIGLAIAAEREVASATPPCVTLSAGRAAPRDRRLPPRVLDLSALWAGPLAAHLLLLAGAQVTRLESLSRTRAAPGRDIAFLDMLAGGKTPVSLNLSTEAGYRALLMLIGQSDIVIEAARPRALLQLGIDADRLVRETPGLVWVTITAHGATGEAASWVGFGDDCGVAAGLSAALRAATGEPGFVGDAVADPLTGIFAARVAWQAWETGRSARFGLSMRAIAALGLEQARAAGPACLDARLRAWHASAGEPFAAARRDQPAAGRC